jgi:molybdopterin/thiamine biosynthesis adenylyltransferase
MDDQQLLKYSRHILLPQLDVDGQQKLLEARVLIVGLGGLGSPVAMYLAASGVGQLFLNDDDSVDISNLQRQIIHRVASVRMSKVISAKQCLHALNPDCSVVELPHKLDQTEMNEQIQKVDVVVDCSDNFATRLMLNQLCFKNKKPLVSGAAIRFEGQLTVFHYQNETDACYACLYPGMGDDDQSCTTNGVLSPVVGVIGSLQAVEVIKLITGIGQTLRNRLLVFDALGQETRAIKYKRDSLCPVCAR